MDGWMDYTGLARQCTDRKALYEARAGGMNHDVWMYYTGLARQWLLQPALPFCIAAISGVL